MANFDEDIKRITNELMEDGTVDKIICEKVRKGFEDAIGGAFRWGELKDAIEKRVKDVQDFIKDADCTKDTPVIYGKEDAPIYGTGIKLKPRIPGREDSEHMKQIYLKELFPLNNMIL